MALFDSQSLKRLRSLALVARRAGGGLLSKPRGRLPAGGTELTGHRDYAPGDDYRRLDWNLCARHDELLVKQYQGEADCPVSILLDCSRSMSLGRPSKFDVARQVTAALAYVALAELEQVSVFGYSDRIVADLGPIRDKSKILQVVRFLEGLVPRGEATDLRAVAERFARRGQRRGLVVVVSDLYDARDFRRGLDLLRNGGYHPRVVQLHDPREAQPDALGDSELVDVETGASWQVTVTERHVARYRRLHAEFLHSVRSYCVGREIGCVQIPVDLPREEVLLRSIGSKSGNRSCREELTGGGFK